MVSLVGVDNDVLTFWLRQGLIRPIHAAAGKGRHLRFDYYQLRIAMVLSIARHCALTLDALRAISVSLQDAIATFQRLDLDNDMVIDVIGEIDGSASIEQTISSLRAMVESGRGDHVQGLLNKKEREGYLESVKEAASIGSREDLNNLWLFWQVWNSEGYLLVYRSGVEQKWHIEARSEITGNQLPARACVLIDLQQIPSDIVFQGEC